MNPILECGAFELADQIRTGKRTSREIVDAHIQEIENWNPLLNALVEDRFEGAREQASYCDQEVERGTKNLPPLWGVPFTLKEMIGAKGFKQTLGNVHREHDRTRDNASAVERLLDAGAILLGTTNVPELGLWYECSNLIYGRTNNPYDLSRTPGGSSGGEAALIGAGASPIGLGSDVGGSIRIPSAFCGIFGHKPSSHLIPLTGHFPMTRENASQWARDRHPLTVIGPMARKATDLYPLMQLLIGPDGWDPEVGKAQLGPRVHDWSKITVWTLASPVIKGVSATDPTLSTATLAAAHHFEKLGAKVKKMREDIFADAVALWFVSMTATESHTFVEVLTQGKPTSLLQELALLVLKKNHYSFPAIVAGLLEDLANQHKVQTAAKRNELLLQLQVLKKNIHALLHKDSILLLPPHPRLAPKHHSALLRPFDFAPTGIFNSLQMPVTSAVIGSHEGLPISIQIASGDQQDHLTLSAAESLEQAFGGWKAPRMPPE